jgi:mono/diheme cytochrome c family protein
MLTPRRTIRLLAAVTGLVAVVATASGCGTTKANEERGRSLFKEKCGTCHALAQAGTTAQVGPNLDDAFAAARAAGQGGSTIEGVVKSQVAHPRPVTDNPSVSMPPSIVSGQDLEDVAAYVGRWAGVPGAAPPKVAGGPGAQVFANNGCGTCHTLAAAESGGTTGPNLDEALTAAVTPAALREMITDPNAKIAKGYKANIMPSNFGQVLTPKELNDMIQFLLESTPAGGGGKGKGA